MRTIKDLLNNDGRVYIYLRTKELQELFLHRAEAEGFTFSDGVKPTQRATDDIIAINDDLTINYVGYVGHVAFKIAERIGEQLLMRVDYEEYIGFNMRTTVKLWKEIGIKKYFLSPGYNKAINLYGLWENGEEIEKAGYVVVVEAEKSVLKRDSVLDHTLVALSGKSMSEEQRRILLGLDVKEIVIALDKDVPLYEVWHMCEKLWRFRRVSYIFDKQGILGEKDSPADARMKDYDSLFENRVQ